MYKCEIKDTDNGMKMTLTKVSQRYLFYIWK
jgi:hypothetical protein